MARNPHDSAQCRTSGVLVHVTSLPSFHGIGDMGDAAHAWVDALGRAGQSWWQILPLTPPGDGDSPYNSFSALAGNPLLISLDALVEDGLLDRADLGSKSTPFPLPARGVDFPRVHCLKHGLLSEAWRRFRGGKTRRLRAEFDSFRQAEKSWLDDFALFAAIREREAKPWREWPRPLAFRDPSALAGARDALSDSVARQEFLQFLFHRQWEKLRRHARARGVGIIGDLPIFVSADSSDVWANPHLFLLDRQRRPKVVAGVPPDYFSTTGQRWGNPLYDWTAMRRDGFRWWVDRAKSALRQADLVRIDHFRGFAACWAVPAHHPTAAGGRWMRAPGKELFGVLGKALGSMPFIAEDLGIITPDVVALRDELGMPGMRVLQFGFGSDPSSPHLPHNFVRNAVAYTGTHDNDTTAGWYASLNKARRAAVLRYAPAAARDPAWEMIRLAWSSVADYAITPLQDVLSLGDSARMNRPGTSAGNWRWRVTQKELTSDLLDRLAEFTKTYGRKAGR